MAEWSLREKGSGDSAASGGEMHKGEGRWRRGWFAARNKTTLHHARERYACAVRAAARKNESRRKADIVVFWYPWGFDRASCALVNGVVVWCTRLHVIGP